MRRTTSAFGVAALALVLVGATGCDQKKADQSTPQGQDKAAQEKAGDKAQKKAGDKADAKKADAKKADAKPKLAELVTPKPAALPADMPKYEGIEAIPAEAYEVHTKMGDKPATILLKKDAVIHGVPCMAKERTGFYNGEKFASCTLAMDFTLENIALQKGTKIRFQTDGRFVGFELPHPQLVLGQPVSAKERVNLTADRAALSNYTLAKDHTFGKLALKAGSKVSFAPNANGHPLDSVKVKGQTKLDGTTYGDGVRLYLKPDGTLLMARGIAKKPAPPLTCPDKSTVTVTAKNRAWPQDGVFGDVTVTGVSKRSKHQPIANTDKVTLYLTNYEVPTEGFNVFRANPPEGKALLELGLKRAGGQKLEVGTYQVAPASDSDYYTSARLRLPGKRSLAMASWKTTGAVEVTVIDGDKICGRFDLKDPYLSIKGTFVATAPAPAP